MVDPRVEGLHLAMVKKLLAIESEGR